MNKKNQGKHIKKLPIEYKDLNEFIIDLKDFVKLDVLGKGSFGTVWKAQHISNGWIVAIKEFSIVRSKDKNLTTPSPSNEQSNSFDEDDFFREVRILTKCTNNPFLIHLVGFSFIGTYAIVTSFIPCGSLWDVLHPNNPDKYQSNTQQSQDDDQNQKKSLNDTQKTIIALGMSYAIKFLHFQNIIHLDLKSPNVLLNDKILPQIADFGLSQFYSSQSYKSNNNSNDPASSEKSGPVSGLSLKGTPMWMAPEQLSGSQCGPASDIFSFAVILYELYTGNEPYPGLSHAQIFYKVVKSNERPKLPENKSPLSQLILRCWEPDPSKRPSASEIYDRFKSGEISFPNSERRYVIEIVKMIEKYESSIREAVAKEASIVNQVISLRQMKKKLEADQNDNKKSVFEDGGESSSIMRSKRYFMSCLTRFASFGQLEEFDVYVSALPSLNLNETDDKGMTPIQAAIANDQLIIVQYLARLPIISNRAKNNTENDRNAILNDTSNNNSHNGSTANLNINSDLLLFDINATDSDGNTPFLLAVSLFKPRIVAYLAQLKKVNVNAQNKYGYSALHLMLRMSATNKRDVKDKNLNIMMKALSFAKNLRIDLKDKDGKEAFEGNPELLAEFVKRQEVNKEQI